MFTYKLKYKTQEMFTFKLKYKIRHMFTYRLKYKHHSHLPIDPSLFFLYLTSLFLLLSFLSSSYSVSFSAHSFIIAFLQTSPFPHSYSFLKCFQVFDSSNLFLSSFSSSTLCETLSLSLSLEVNVLFSFFSYFLHIDSSTFKNQYSIPAFILFFFLTFPHPYF